MEFLKESDEGYGTLNNQFDKVFTLTPKAQEYEKDLEGAISDAKRGNDDAEIFLISKCKKMIFHVFWANFIGEKASKRVIARRLANDEFNDFLSLVYIAFEKAIKAFSLASYDKVKIGNFQYYLGRYLKAESISYNTRENDDPSSKAIRPDSVTSETESKGSGTGNAWDYIVGGAEDENYVDFLENWKDFCNDPRMSEPLSKKIKTPLKIVLVKILSGDKTIPQIADELGITKATLYSAIDIGDILSDNGIEQSEMAKYLKAYPDELINKLRG